MSQIWHCWKHQCDRWPGEEAGHPIQWSDHQHAQVVLHLLRACVWREWESHHRGAGQQGEWQMEEKLTCISSLQQYKGSLIILELCNWRVVYETLSSMKAIDLWKHYIPDVQKCSVKHLSPHSARNTCFHSCRLWCIESPLSKLKLDQQVFFLRECSCFIFQTLLSGDADGLFGQVFTTLKTVRVWVCSREKLMPNLTVILPPALLWIK